MAYDDPVLAVADDLARRGVKSSAVREQAGYVSQDIIARNWVQIEGVAHYVVTGRPPESVSEYCDRVCKDHPNYFYEEHVVDDTDICFLGTDGKRTLKDAGDFVEKYGEKHYHETKLAYGCDDTLKPGTKPGGKPAGASASNRDNPYAPCAHGGEQARMGRIIKLVSNPAGAKIAPSLARSAKPPCRIDGSLL